MKKINWKARLKNPHTIIALAAALLLFAEQAAALFGYEVPATTNEQIMDLIRTVLAILALIGVIEDPLTEGIGDSELGITYERPKKKGE